MTLPLVAVVGRPNVGKSTLVNRIIQTDAAIVHEMRGVTRDRSYHDADWNGVKFRLVDTGGIEMGTDDDFQGSIRAQAFEATREADVIIFLVDGKTGINADDEEVAKILRRSEKPVLLAVNKMDNPGNTDALWEFYALGLGDPLPVSATHGHGSGDLLDEVVLLLKNNGLADYQPPEDEGIRIAIIGRPNAGKSSLTNRLTDSERSIVSDVAGTTRDAIDTKVTHGDRLYTIIDTAGLRQKSRIEEDVEYYGFVRALRAIDRADVAVLVVDGTLGLTDQDQRVARDAHDRGCAMVIALNKWDVVEGPEAKAEVRLAEKKERRALHRIEQTPAWRSEWVFTLARRFQAGMPLHDGTFSTHSAFLMQNGEILYGSEDISRHNAVDKVIGHALTEGVPLSACILFTSGRVPKDMAEKTVADGNTWACLTLVSK